MDIVKVAAFCSKDVSTLDFLQVMRDAIQTTGPETGKKQRDQVSREVGGTIQWVADKVEELMTQSRTNDTLNNNLQPEHFEELRQVAISKLETMDNDEENKDIIIDSLVYFKTKL
jgi:hypothetical protein